MFTPRSIITVAFAGSILLTSGTGGAQQYKVDVKSQQFGIHVQTDTPGGRVGSFGGNGDFAIDAPLLTGGRLIVKEGGNVGIGTATPGYKLDVNGSINGTSLFVNGVAVGAGGSQWTSGASGLISYTGGNVGIGTTATSRRLDVAGSIVATAAPAGPFGGDLMAVAGEIVNNPFVDAAIGVYGKCAPQAFFCTAIKGQASGNNHSGEFWGGRGVYVASDNTVGIHAQASGSSAEGIEAISEDYRGGYFLSQSTGRHSLYVDTAGGPSQGVSGLYVNGSIQGAGDLLMGGSKAGYVVDIMQNVDSIPLEPGDVVVITGSAAPVLGQIPVVTVKKATSAYDTAVAGTVDQAMYVPDLATKTAYETQERAARAATDQRAKAGAAVAGARITPMAIAEPEMTITDEQGTLHALPELASVGPGGYLSVVTLGSFKMVKVDASFGAIHAGDLLTTSSHAGYAMKVADKVAAIGAIVGKALGNLDSGIGTVPVLVMPR